MQWKLVLPGRSESRTVDSAGRVRIPCGRLFFLQRGEATIVARTQLPHGRRVVRGREAEADLRRNKNDPVDPALESSKKAHWALQGRIGIR